MINFDKNNFLDENFFKEIPKIDIHCHLYGAIREETFKEFSLNSNCTLSDKEISEFYIRGEKPKGVLSAFRILEEFILNDANRLYRITQECLEDLSKDNVHYVELFWNSTGTLYHNLSMTFESAQSAIINAMIDAENKFNIKSNLIHAIDRQASPESATDLIDNILKFRNHRAVGIGIDYLETGFPPESFWLAYKKAKKAGLKTTAHAGEFGCHWRNIESCLNLLKVDRLDHCYTILDNESLIKQCIERDITITIVPSNSYYMRTLDKSEWSQKHPIRKMFKKGLKVHPNTDDPTFHNVTPAIVWKMMFCDFGYSIDELKQCMLNGLDGAWLNDQVRQELKEEFSLNFESTLKKFLIKKILN